MSRKCAPLLSFQLRLEAELFEIEASMHACDGRRRREGLGRRREGGAGVGKGGAGVGRGGAGVGGGEQGGRGRRGGGRRMRGEEGEDIHVPDAVAFKMLLMDVTVSRSSQVPFLKQCMCRART